jgi:hypothetical protein
MSATARILAACRQVSDGRLLIPELWQLIVEYVPIPTWVYKSVPEDFIPSDAIKIAPEVSLYEKFPSDCLISKYILQFGESVRIDAKFTQYSIFYTIGVTTMKPDPIEPGASDALTLYGAKASDPYYALNQHNALSKLVFKPPDTRQIMQLSSFELQHRERNHIWIVLYSNNMPIFETLICDAPYPVRPFIELLGCGGTHPNSIITIEAA